MGTIKNSKKPILGTIAGVATYAFCILVLQWDETASAGAAATVSAFVVKQAGPIFGEKVGTPKVETNPATKEKQVILPLPAPYSQAPGEELPTLVIETKDRDGVVRRRH